MAHNWVYAGFWRRLAALLLDSLIMLVAYIIFLWGLAFFKVVEHSSILTPHLPPMLSHIGSVLLPALYSIFFLSSSWQATPGKRIMHVFAIRSEDGGRMSFIRASFRYVVLNFFVLIAPLMSPSMMNPSNTAQAGHSTVAQDADLSLPDQERFASLENKAASRQPMTAEEQQFYQETLRKAVVHYVKQILSTLPLLVYAIVTALMVGLTRRKTGPHDLIARTRVMRGTPDMPLTV